MSRWVRIALLTFIAALAVTVVVGLIGGTWGYVAGGIVLFVVVALGSPLALRRDRPLLPGAPVGNW